MPTLWPSPNDLPVPRPTFTVTRDFTVPASAFQDLENCLYDIDTLIRTGGSAPSLRQIRAAVYGALLNSTPVAPPPTPPVTP